MVIFAGAGVYNFQKPEVGAGVYFILTTKQSWLQYQVSWLQITTSGFIITSKGGHELRQKTDVLVVDGQRVATQDALGRLSLVGVGHVHYLEE